MAKQRFVIKITVTTDARMYTGNECTFTAQERREQQTSLRDAFWLGEILRYAGLTNTLTTAADGNAQVFEFPAPAGQDSWAWCTLNANRMRSFGLNAVVVPAAR